MIGVHELNIRWSQKCVDGRDWVRNYLAEHPGWHSRAYLEWLRTQAISGEYTLYDCAQVFYMFMLEEEGYSEHGIPTALLRMWQPSLVRDGLLRHCDVPNDVRMCAILNTRQTHNVDTYQDLPKGVNMLDAVYAIHRQLLTNGNE